MSKIRELVTFLSLLLPCSFGADNILIITCDNLGYGDLQSYNPNATTKTPRLNQFASEGARLTSFYTASPTCTVSRACLLTGRIPQRHGLLNQLSGVSGNYGVGLRQSEVLIPRILKSAPTPYSTACFGKWNIGFAEGSRPTERGFDDFIGHASGNLDYYNHNYRDKHDLYRGIEPLNLKGKYITDIFADAAVDYIEWKTKQPDQPWFIYLPFNAPHFPTKGNKQPGQANIYQAPDWAFAAIGLKPDETDARKRYEAVVYTLDHAIGRVLDQLDKSEVAERTFVFFMSDNGAFRLNRKGLDVGINDPLRSGGVTCWEGGLRVPAMVRWPGKIKPGSVNSEPLWSPDLLVTSAKIANAPIPKDVDYDGKNLIPVLTEGKPSPHESYYFEYRNHAALRQGNLKIVREKSTAPWQLFDLSRDLVETTDLSLKQPQKVVALEKTFNEWRDSF